MFEYEIRRDSVDQVTVQIKGTLVLGSPTNRLRACLKTVTDRYPKILIEATDLKNMDSSGLGELVLAHAEAKAHGGTVELIGATKHIRNLLVLTKLVTVFGVSTETQPEQQININLQ
jgi:anti-sigma B factor antagonist